MNVRPKGTARPQAMVLVGSAIAFAVAGASVAPAASSSVTSGAPHRPLHVPHLSLGKRCPISLSQTARWGTDGLQALTGRGPVYLIGGGRISIALSARDRLGWQGQKTPWAVRRSYDGPILVRGAPLVGSARCALLTGTVIICGSSNGMPAPIRDCRQIPTSDSSLRKRSFERPVVTRTRSTAPPSAKSSSSASRAEPANDPALVAPMSRADHRRERPTEGAQGRQQRPRRGSLGSVLTRSKFARAASAR
jgi:hypothetical protein